MTKPVVIVGAGWSGAVIANRLAREGIPVEVLEAASVVGGHSRTETLCGIEYEPNGPHIFHTSNERVMQFVGALGMTRAYTFQPKTLIDVGQGPDTLMSWPIQVDELEELPMWYRIKEELDELPPEPSGDDFETYAVSLMGRTLYELFIEGYTRKQWGCEPSALSSSFAPKRIDIRRDGNRNLFRDRWSLAPNSGVNDAIGTLLRPSGVTCGAYVTADDLMLVPALAFVVTAPLDSFAGGGWMGAPLPWRGVQTQARFISRATAEGKATPAYVINQPSIDVPHTRSVESKWATGQIREGTVVGYEFPGAAAKHYPVADVHGANDGMNDELKRRVRDMLGHAPVYFAGRLANYRYINQDEAIEQAWACADQILAELHCA